MSDTPWIYELNPDDRARTLLGLEGERPLVCVGINPSTAAPGGLNPTVASVSRVAGLAGFDSFMMLNVYAQRATDPDDMHSAVDPRLHEWNLRTIASFVRGRPLIMWAAWGTLIRKRPYLSSLSSTSSSLPNCRSVSGTVAAFAARTDTRTTPYTSEKMRPSTHST